MSVCQSNTLHNPCPESTTAVAFVEWSWNGHHPNYLINFVLAAARVGQRVLPVCPDPRDFSNKLTVALSVDDNPEIRDLIEEPIKTPCANRSKIRPARFRDLHNTWRRFFRLGRVLRKWEKEEKCSVRLVFFACIFDHDFYHFRRVDRFFGYKWSGLYMHARFFRMPESKIPDLDIVPNPKEFFASPLLESVGVLDEGAVEPLRHIVKDKPVVWMPDFTDERLCTKLGNGPSLAKKIKSFAQGRKIVSLVGYLLKSKGLEDFTAVIESGVMKDTFFFLGGEVRWLGIDDPSRSRIRKVWEEAENVYPHLQPISSDVEMNSVISVSDVIFAVYWNFPSSSNILTKAAVLRRPIIVADGYLMGERVRDYRLGEVVEQGNIKSILEALKKMLDSNYYNDLEKGARWEDFRSRQSVKQLPGCFKKLIFTKGKTGICSQNQKSK